MVVFSMWRTWIRSKSPSADGCTVDGLANIETYDFAPSACDSLLIVKAMSYFPTQVLRPSDAAENIGCEKTNCTQSFRDHATLSGR